MPRTPKTPVVTAARPGIPSEAAKAFASVAQECADLPPSELSPINVDIPRAVAIAIGAVPHVATLRDRAAKLPDFDVACIDKLGTYALAAWYTHLMALPEVVPSRLAALLEEAKPLREDALLAAELLARKGFFDKKAIAAIRAGQGNLDTANDLVALAAVFAAGWPRVENRTTVVWAEVERASTLGPEILIALGERNQPGVQLPDATNPAERRVRAYTLFARAYDQCRRAAAFLRWDQNDADDIAPSLQTGRAGRKATPSPEAIEAPEGSEEPVASPAAPEKP